jgi:hypothetical protein
MGDKEDETGREVSTPLGRHKTRSSLLCRLRSDSIRRFKDRRHPPRLTDTPIDSLRRSCSDIQATQEAVTFLKYTIHVATFSPRNARSR